MKTIKFKAWSEIEKIMLDAKTIQEFTSQINISEQSANRLVYLQFIGLTDKNGVEIYEGDIIKMKNFNSTVKVEYIEFYAEFMFVDKLNLRWSKGEACNREVIGNIYQNLDLLTD